MLALELLGVAAPERMWATANQAEVIAVIAAGRGASFYARHHPAIVKPGLNNLSEHPDLHSLAAAIEIARDHDLTVNEPVMPRLLRHTSKPIMPAAISASVEGSGTVALSCGEDRLSMARFSPQ